MKKPTLHLMVGLPGSGKTTRAKELEKELQLVRFTPDDWQLRLFGDETDDPKHDDRHTEVEKIMWELAEQLLQLGVSVVLDFGFWSREERASFYAQAKRLNVHFQIHYMDVPMEELLARIERRNVDPNAPSFTIFPQHMREWAQMFQPVTEEELVEYRDLLPPIPNTFLP